MAKTIRRGEIYFIYPTSIRYGAEVFSGRPAVIVSNDRINQSSGCVEVVYMTTKEKPKLATHFTTTSSGKAATVLCEQISSVTEERIGDYYGKLNKAEIAELDRCLGFSIGISAFRDDSIPDICKDETFDAPSGRNMEQKSGTEISECQKEIQDLHDKYVAQSAKLELLENLFNQVIKKRLR